MNKLKKSLSLFVALVLLFGVAVVPSAAQTTQEAWDNYYAVDPAVSAGVVLTPGSDESERYLSWYTAAADGNEAVLTESGGRETAVKAQTVQTLQGDYRARVVFTGLKPGADYSYIVKSGDGKVYGPYSFSTLAGGDFTALYVTDIHVTDEEPNEDGVIAKPLSQYAYRFHETIERAAQKAGGLDLILSAGDQASSGLRSEYTALAASPALKSVPFAMAIGNHDRKHVDYRFFKWQPNAYHMLVSQYIGGDYWFVKGDALFLVFDSNNGSAIDHRNFARQACAQNPSVKWRVAMFHHDLYGQRIPHRESENELLRLVWAPICDEFGIDLCLLGHSHYYTLSNVLYNQKTVTDIRELDRVTDPKGTLYMVSGSINRPREIEADTPVGDRVGQYYDTQDVIYNTLSFRDSSLTIRSYTLEGDEKFNEFTISKTSAAGGHVYKTAQWYAPLIRFIGTIYAVFNNMGKYSDYKGLGINVKFFDIVFGGGNG